MHQISYKSNIFITYHVYYYKNDKLTMVQM
jgi:uncharacterized protein YcfL